jgi:hypothetical protein
MLEQDKWLFFFSTRNEYFAPLMLKNWACAINQGTLSEVEGSVPMASLLR